MFADKSRLFSVSYSVTSHLIVRDSIQIKKNQVEGRLNSRTINRNDRNSPSSVYWPKSNSHQMLLCHLIYSRAKDNI